MHKHQCPRCGYVWEHPATCSVSHASHCCPLCSYHEHGGTTAKHFDLEPHVTFLRPHKPGTVECPPDLTPPPLQASN